MKSIIQFSLIIFLFACTVFAQNGGYALEFNGMSGVGGAVIPFLGNTNSTITLEMWFAPVTVQAGVHYLAALHSLTGAETRRVMLFLDSGAIGVYCAPNTGDENNAINVSTGITVTANVWYHIAVTINGSTLKMFVNGKLYVTTGLTDVYSLTGTEELDLAWDLSGIGYSNIKLDEVRFWSSERTEAQIKANMYKELTGSEAGLLAYYKMSDGGGSSLSDNQISGTYGGDLQGDFTWIASGAFADSRNALDFDGSNDYVDCGNSASVQRNGTQSFTLEAWVKPTGGIWVSVISKFVHTASNEGYSLEIYSDNKVSLLYGNNWANWNATASSVSLTPGVWSHIAATYDGATVNVYINGLLVASAAWTFGLTDSGTNLLLGSRSGTTFYSGQMDEARVWTVARTQAQIQETMCRTLVGNEAGLAAYYRLDQIDGTTTYDLTSNANNGTLINMDPATDWVASDAFNTWLGSESTSWSNAGNWSKGAVPTSSNSVGIYNWALGHPIIISSSPTINNIFISSTSNPILSSGMTVNMNLMLGKNLILNGQTVTLGSVGNLFEGAYRLWGTSGTITTTRNLNNISNLDVAGLGAQITTAANMGSTTITRGPAHQTGNGNYSIYRYYDITPTNNSSLNATLVFHYIDSEVGALFEGDFVLYRSIDGGTSWTNQGGTLDAANNTITKTGISSFSRWTVGSLTTDISNSPPAAPTATAATAITSTGFSTNWNAASGSTKYYLDVSASNSFASFVTGYNNLDVSNVTTYSVSGLLGGTTYYYRVRAYNPSGTSGSSNTISVTTNNTAPTAANSTVTTLENSDKIFASTDFGYTDPDGNILAQVQIVTIPSAGKLYKDSNLNGTVDGAEALTNGAVITKAEIDAGKLKFKPGTNEYASPYTTFTYKVHDGTTYSASSYTMTINVTFENQAPIIFGIEKTPLNYAEGESAKQITGSIAVNDAEGEVVSADIQISGNYQNGEDVLSYTSQNGITGTWKPESGTLSLSGSSIPFYYQQALRSVMYQNNSQNPKTLQRTVSFAVSDGKLSSNTLSRDIIVAAVNNAPILSAIESTAIQYIQGDPATQITNTITLQDPDNTNMQNAVVQISANYKNGEDVLSFADQNGITGRWDATAGTLTLSGSSSLANYQTALRGVSYLNSSKSPNTLPRTISLSVNDGSLTSNVLTRIINVIAKYTITLTANPADGGTITGAGTFNAGSSATVTATANVGYTFAGWTDGGTVVSSTPSYTFTVNSDRNLTANFSAIQFKLTTSSLPIAGGSTSGGGTYNIGQNVTLKATANSAYNFVNWTIGSSILSTNSSYTCTINEATLNILSIPLTGGSQNVTANFQKAVGIKDLDMNIPTTYKLEQNYPNPFNPTTVIRYGLPNDGFVKINVYNILGKEVAMLVNKVQSAGYHEVPFDASKLNSGMYLYKIESEGFLKIMKMMLVK